MYMQNSRKYIYLMTVLHDISAILKDYFFEEFEDEGKVYAMRQMYDNCQRKNNVTDLIKLKKIICRVGLEDKKKIGGRTRRSRRRSYTAIAVKKCYFRFAYLRLDGLQWSVYVYLIDSSKFLFSLRLLGDTLSCVPQKKSKRLSFNGEHSSFLP